MRRRGFILGLVTLACLSLGACNQNTGGGAATQETAADATTGEGPTVVMLGDSLTAGYELPAWSALPAAIQRRFDADAVKAHIVNAGVSGDTTGDALNRYDFSVKQANPKMLVVALGANDFLNGGSPDTAKKNLAAILDQAHRDEIPAVLIGIKVPETAGASGDEAAWLQIYPDLAKQYEAPLYPNMLAAIAGKPEFLMPDGLHPTADGVEAMAADIAGFLEPLVKDLP